MSRAENTYTCQRPYRLQMRLSINNHKDGGPDKRPGDCANGEGGPFEKRF